MVQPGPLKRLQIFVVRKLVILRALRWSVILLHSSPTAHHVGKVRECFALQVMIHAYSVGKLDAFIPESPKIFPGLLDPVAESMLISDSDTFDDGFVPSIQLTLHDNEFLLLVLKHGFLVHIWSHNFEMISNVLINSCKYCHCVSAAYLWLLSFRLELIKQLIFM